MKRASPLRRSHLTGEIKILFGQHDHETLGNTETYLLLSTIPFLIAGKCPATLLYEHMSMREFSFIVLQQNKETKYRSNRR